MTLKRGVIGAQNLTALSVLYWFNRGYRCHPMPNQLEAFKMAEGGRMQRGRLIALIIVITIVATLMAYWANLYVTFNEGATGKAVGFKRWVGSESYDRLNGWLQTPTKPDRTQIGYVIGGAIVVLGLNTIKNLALSTAALETMSMKGQSAMNMDEFWKHVLGAGVTAKLIARRIGVNKNFLEDYFLAGLMHDMGKIVLNRLNPVGYKKVITVCAEKGVDLQLVESRVFGINHAEIGGLLAEKWGLQNSLREAMAFHHSPDQASGENRKLVLAIYISNAFTKVHSVGVSGNTFIQELGEQGWADLGMRPEALQEMAGMLIEGVERASIFLQTAG